MEKISSPVRVVHIATTAMAVRYLLLGQLRYLRQAGYRVAVISSPGPDVAAIHTAGIRHISIPMSRRILSPVADARACLMLAKVLRREGFVIVHTHTPKAGILGRWAAKLASVPIIVHTNHGLYLSDGMPASLRLWYLALERSAAAVSDLIFSNNAEDVALATEAGIWPQGKVMVLETGAVGVDLARFDPRRFSEPTRQATRTALGLPAHGQVIGFVGRLVREKGVLDLLAAARIVSRHVSDVAFLFVGPSDVEKSDAVTSEAAALYGVEDRCTFTGARQDVPDIYSVMDVLVLPSHREGFGQVLAEAAAMGIPVVATDIRGCRELVQHGRTGLLVPREDIQALAEAIIRLLQHPEGARLMGEYAFRLARERFDERLLFARLSDAYAALLRQKGLPGPSLATASG